MDKIDLFYRVIAPYFNFFLFLFLAVRFFKKPLTSLVRGASANFESTLGTIQTEKTNALKQEEELTNRLYRLQGDIETMRESIRTSAQAEADDLVNKAKLMSENILKESEKLVQAKLAIAEQKLKKSIADMVYLTVSEKISKELSDSAQHEIVHKKVSILSKIDTNIDTKYKAKLDPKLNEKGSPG